MSQQVLTPEQGKMITLTCQGVTNTAIAETLGVARKTIIRWHKLPHIQQAIAEANTAASRGIAKQQEKKYEEIAKSAQAATHEIVEKLLPAAVSIVGRILANSESKDSDRLRASELIAKWGGLEKANQPQQTAELTLKQYLIALETKPNVSNN